MKSKIQLQILTSLRRLHPRMMLQDELLAEVRMAFVERPTAADLNHALRELEEELGQIIVVKGEDRTFVKITPDGIARHEEASR